MKTTALLVVDLQRGAFDGARCSVISEPDRLISQALALVGAARKRSLPVFFVQHCEGPGEVFEEGSVHGQLHEALTPLPTEKVLQKHATSAFEDTPLETTLRELEATELVLCGLQSEFCIADTAKSALKLGFAVVVAMDAHRTWPSGGEPAAAISARVNDELQAAGAALRSTAELVRSWSEAPT